jgi:hypothetical protein
MPHFANYREASWKLTCKKLTILKISFRWFFSNIRSICVHVASKLTTKARFGTWRRCVSLATATGITMPSAAKKSLILQNGDCFPFLVKKLFVMGSYYDECDQCLWATQSLIIASYDSLISYLLLLLNFIFS